MKRLFGIIVLSLELLSVVGCDKLFTPDSLSGTVWEVSEEARYSSSFLVLSFSDTDYLMKISLTTSDGTQVVTIEGSYTYIAPNLLLRHQNGDMSGSVSGMRLDIYVDGTPMALHRTK